MKQLDLNILKIRLDTLFSDLERFQGEVEYEKKLYWKMQDLKSVIADFQNEV